MALLQVKVYSQQLRTSTDVQVILPTPRSSEAVGENAFKYYDRDNPCPVLYLFHGTHGDSGDWMRYSMVEAYARDYNVAVVMPEVANSVFRDMPRGGPKYYAYLTEELPKMMSWMFPISQKREDTFIAGLSMGGNGAFKIGMSKPEMFGYVACLSSGFGEIFERVGNDPESPWSMAFELNESVKGTADDQDWLSSQLIEKQIDYPKLYLCCGTEDFLYEENCRFRKHLDNIGFKYDYHEQPGIHNWIFWNDEIQRVLEWLPIKKK